MKQNKPVVFITGGSRGIGQELVEKFKQQNWQVAACATSADSAKKINADFANVCDVSSSTQVKSTIADIIKKFGRLDVVINNAGIAGENPLDPESSNDLWHRIIDVNLHGTYYVCKYALPHLPNQTGRIINISSVLGLKSVADQSAYCAAKHAVMGFTKSLALKVAPRNITVNAICPGWTRTDMALDRFEEIGVTEDQINQSIPLNKIVTPHEVADLAFFIATSKAGAMMTGQAFTIDGGDTL